jgi:hypothetical protein
MSEKLWVECKIAEETFKSKVSIEGCVDVDDFIKKIRNESQLGIPKDSKVTLCTPSGTTIEINESSSSLLSGNSFTNPLHVQVSALPLITIKPAPDADLTSFWNSLRQMSAKKDFLEFPLMINLIEESNQTVYIRRAYEDLFNIIINNLNPEKPKKRVHRMAITGTPGVGKSTFLLYVLWRLAHMETTKTVILRRHMDEKAILVFQNDGCWVTLDDKDLYILLKDAATWYLADTLDPPPGQVNAVTILVASPARRHYEAFGRYLNTPPLHYFPIWSLEELKLLADAYSRDLKDIEERYYKIGGIPRYVLEKDHNLKTVIRSAVGRLAIEKFPLIASGSVSKEDQVSHLIVQFVVDTTSYQDFTLQMASSYATEMAMEVFLQNQEEEVKRFILSNSPIPALATLRGSMFEAYAHQKLAMGGKFIGRSLENSEECELDISMMKIGRFFKVSECIDSKMYYVPWYSNHPCIDSVVLDKGYFQMTIASEHDIVWGKLKEMVDELKMDKLYFVVPHTIFEEFQKQKLVRNMTSHGNANQEGTSTRRQISNEDEEKNRKKRRRVGENKNKRNSQDDLVHQYVISISLEPNLKALLSKIVHGEQMMQQDG